MSFNKILLLLMFSMPIAPSMKIIKNKNIKQNMKFFNGGKKWTSPLLQIKGKKLYPIYLETKNFTQIPSQKKRTSQPVINRELIKSKSLHSEAPEDQKLFLWLDNAMKKGKDISGSIEENLFFKSVPFGRAKQTPQSSFAQAKFKSTAKEGSEGYLKWLVGGTLAAVLAQYLSQKAHAEEDFDYSLDGENARTMNADAFVEQLHKRGKTVRDAVDELCAQYEKKIYKELTDLLQLSDDNWKSWNNLWKIKHEFLKGNYRDDNITFKCDLTSTDENTIKDVFKRANLPLKVTVKTKEFRRTEDGKNAPNAAQVGWAFSIKPGNVKLDTFLKSASRGEIINALNVQLNVSTDFFTLPLPTQKAILAHETVHLLNLHGLEESIFKHFLMREGEEYKKFGRNYGNVREKAFELLDTLHEFQADVRPLAFKDYAFGQIQAFYRDFYCADESPIHISHKKGLELAVRALKLHQAEERLLNNNKIRPSSNN